MSNALTIEKGVPQPPRHGEGLSAAVRALALAEVGDSILFQDANQHTLRGLAVSVAGSGWASCRKLVGGMRVWKVAEPNPEAIARLRQFAASHTGTPGDEQ